MANSNPNNDRPTIIVAGPPTLFRMFGEKFAEKFGLLKPWDSPLPLKDYLSTHASSVSAMLCAGTFRVSADILGQLPCLRLIVTTSAGVDHIDLSECRRFGVAVANVAGIFSADVADLAVGLVIDVLRRISASDRYVKSGVWPIKGEFPLGSMLGGKKIGIVGLGSIGQEVAKRLQPFGCEISYYSREKKPLFSYSYHADVKELATVCDILVICCALTDQTHHLINRDVLLALGKGGVVVNIARGAIINEKELVQCLLAGEIAGAGLDVFEDEPNVPMEFRRLDNVVLSSHSAVFTHESSQQAFDLVVGNLEAFFSNKPLLSPVFCE